MADECVTADEHVVTLREGNQRIPASEVLGIGTAVGPGMDEAELHLVLRLQLAECRASNRRIFGFAQITGGRTDRDVAQFPSLAEGRRIGGSHTRGQNTSNCGKEQKYENGKNCSTGMKRRFHGPILSALMLGGSRLGHNEIQPRGGGHPGRD